MAGIAAQGTPVGPSPPGGGGGGAQPLGSAVKVVISATLSIRGDIVHFGGTGEIDAVRRAIQFNTLADNANIPVPPPGILVVKGARPTRGLLEDHVVVQQGFMAIVTAASGAAGGAGGGGGPVSALQAATNALQRTATGGGADIPRASTSAQGVAVDVRTEFAGINSYAPDTQISPEEAKYAENVDGITTRGALGKRPGTITTFPNRGEVVNGVAAITAAQLGRSINALPNAFRENGSTLLLLGYDSATDLGKGTIGLNLKRLRAVPVDPLYHPQLDIRRVKPTITINSFLASGIDFDVVAPQRFIRNLGVDRLPSLNQIAVIASDVGFELDPDNEQNAGLGGVYITSPDFQDWDGQSLNFVDAGGTVAIDRFYTVFMFNQREQAEPFTFKVTPA